MYSNIEETMELKLWDDKYPGMVLIVRSGWKDMFHVITESPDAEEYKHEFISKETVKIRYNIDPEDYVK